MNLRLFALCGLAVLTLTGCDSGRQAPGKVSVRVVNVAPSFAQLVYQREQDTNNQQTLAFKAGTEFSYDADTYDFFVGAPLVDPNTTAGPWSFAPTLKENTRYNFVLTEAAGEIVPIVLEYPSAPANDAQILAVHAAESLPTMDLYLERPGVGIGGATPRGTLSFQGQLSARTVPSGDYELWLTAAGNPANVLFTSTGFTLTAGTTSTLIVTPENGSNTAPISVTFQQSGTESLFDRNATSELRILNAATDAAPRDVALNHVFTPPLFAAVPFVTPTAYLTVPVGSSQQLTVTPAGNQGVFELDQAFNAPAGARSTLMVVGDTGTLTQVSVFDDNRRIRGQGKLRFFNAAPQFAATTLELVLTQPGADHTQVFGIAVVGSPASSGQLAVAPDDYDLYVRRVDTDALVAGPLPVHIDERGLYGVLTVNGPDTATATVVLFDDFP